MGNSHSSKKGKSSSNGKADEAVEMPHSEPNYVANGYTSGNGHDDNRHCILPSSNTAPTAEHGDSGVMGFRASNEARANGYQLHHRFVSDNEDDYSTSDYDDGIEITIGSKNNIRDNMIEAPVKEEEEPDDYPWSRENQRRAHGESNTDGNGQNSSDKDISDLNEGKRESLIFRKRPRGRVMETHCINEESLDGEEEERRVNQYILHDIIGRGAFAEVWLASDDSGKLYSIKEMSKQHLKRIRYGSNTFSLSGGPNAEDDVRREILILKALEHPNIVKMYEVLDDPEQDCLFMVFEYAAKGVVCDMGKRQHLPEHKIWKYMRDLIMGLEYLHRLHIVHRDIKPDNLLLSEDDVLKIIDFGVSEKIEKSGILSRSVGSVAFWAPEMCKSDVSKYKGKPIDMWAVGITLYVFCYGWVPFASQVPLDLFDIIVKEEPEFPVLPDGREINPHLKNLIQQLLHKDPEQRLTVGGAKEHRYITGDGKRLLPIQEIFSGSVSEMVFSEEQMAECFSKVDVSKDALRE
eukprot:Nk52_evm15s239 gene=Nk52_evmTU15s239